MIHWKDFIIGAMSVAIAYGLFSSSQEDDIEEIEEEDGVVINGRKFHQLSCQTCRKIKNHREIEPRVFECIKCKRRTDLSRVG